MKLTAKGGLAEPAPSVLFMAELRCAETWTNRVQFLDPTLLVLFSFLPLRLVSIPGFRLLLSLVFIAGLLVLLLHFVSTSSPSPYNLESRERVPSLSTFFFVRVVSTQLFFSLSTVSGSLLCGSLETCGTLGAHFFFSFFLLFLLFTSSSQILGNNLLKDRRVGTNCNIKHTCGKDLWASPNTHQKRLLFFLPPYTEAGDSRDGSLSIEDPFRWLSWFEFFSCFFLNVVDWSPPFFKRRFILSTFPFVVVRGARVDRGKPCVILLVPFF
ncbi:uncharacterized protein J3D65DRAFT_170510 [Phyllosticta citribraziliensis]|uniref:Transmembrane protein n=1 Tax=Phyllosticta citribraziliensis TaxID=989973 RepID=A0ABR1L549_9PEZI